MVIGYRLLVIEAGLWVIGLLFMGDGNRKKRVTSVNMSLIVDCQYIMHFFDFHAIIL